MSDAVKVKRLGNQVKKLKVELTTLKEAYDVLLDHNAQLAKQLDECREIGEKLLEIFGPLCDGGIGDRRHGVLRVSFDKKGGPPNRPATNGYSHNNDNSRERLTTASPATVMGDPLGVAKLRPAARQRASVNVVSLFINSFLLLQNEAQLRLMLMNKYTDRSFPTGAGTLGMDQRVHIGAGDVCEPFRPTRIAGANVLDFDRHRANKRQEPKPCGLEELLHGRKSIKI